jgi:hypothetical protein
LKLPRLLVSAVICLIIAALAYFWATGLMDSLYAFRSPLHDNPPSAGEALGQPLTRRVVFVLIDALRADTAADATIMPFLDELRQQSASATMHSRPPSFSVPGYSVLFTGAWPDLSDGPALNPDYPEIPTWTQDNLFTAAQRAGLKTAASGYNYFEKLIPPDALDASFFTAGEDAAADREVVDAALPWIDSGDYEFILIHIDQVDYAGHHEGGPLDPRWDAAATRADDLVREIASHLDLELDTILVLSDHGQIDAGGHGGHEGVTLVEPFVLAGAGVASGKYDDMEMIDVTPTVAALLGANIPATAQGRVIANMLTLSDEQLSNLINASAAQQQTLYDAFTQAMNVEPVQIQLAPNHYPITIFQSAMESIKNDRLNRERIPRFILVILLFAGIGFLVWKKWNRNFLWMAVLAIVYALLFHLRYAVIAKLTYSLSSVASADALIAFTATTAIISLAIPWWVLFTYLGIFKLEPRRAAEMAFQPVFAVLILLALPIGWSFALNGPLVGWTLPDMPSMFLGFICLLQALIVSAGGILLSGATAFFAWVQGPPQVSHTSNKKRR